MDTPAASSTPKTLPVRAVPHPPPARAPAPVPSPARQIHRADHPSSQQRSSRGLGNSRGRAPLLRTPPSDERSPASRSHRPGPPLAGPWPLDAVAPHPTLPAMPLPTDQLLKPRTPPRRSPRPSRTAKLRPFFNHLHITHPTTAQPGTFAATP